MSERRTSKPRVSLTPTQTQEGIGAELFSLCQGITADGKLSKDEIVALGLWLRDNRDAHLPGIALLSGTLDRIIADGHVTRDEQRELLEAIEKVLPPEARRTAKAARRAVEAERKAARRTAEAKRKADEAAARKEKREQELERQQRRWPEDDFDFMVAGVYFEGRHRIIERCLNVGDRVRIAREPDNPHDDCAVAVTLTDGRKIGYVPRTDSADVSGCLEDGGYYVATVKKILTGGRLPIPVIVLEFYRSDQLADIADLNPYPCRTTSSARPSPGFLIGIRQNGSDPLQSRPSGSALLGPPLAARLGKGAYFAAASVVKWCASVKGDFQSGPEREFRPASFIAKLLVITAVSGALIILLIKLGLFAVSRRA